MSDYEPPYDLSTLLNELPVSVAYEADTNNAKMLSLYADLMVDVQTTLNQINEWRDIDNAQGTALDYIGEDRGVYRNGANDDYYRFLIKTKSLQRVTDGTYNSLIKLIAESLSADYSDIYINPLYNSASNEPDAIEVTNIPDKYLDTPNKKRLVLDRLQESVTAGIRVANVTFQTSLSSEIYVGTALTTMNLVELGSDVDTETFEHEINETSYLRSTQTIQTTYEIESEEV